MSEPARLVLLRHGQSDWNARNLFTGWANPDLTADGEREAVRVGRLLATDGPLRALVKHLDEISDIGIAGVEIPNGIPLLYQLGPDMQPLVKRGRYLTAEGAEHAHAGH